MSYILEALKKSKQERQGGKTPDIHIVHATPSIKLQSSKLSRNGLVIGGGITLIFCCFYYLFSEEPAKKIEEPLRTIIVRKLEVRPQFLGQLKEPTVVVQNSEFMPVLAGSLQQPLRITNDKFKKVVIKRGDNVEEEHAEEMQVLPYRENLPPEIQKEIPLYNFAGHTYADDPSLRMIIINNQILREGDSVDSETTLVSIIWEGVLLNYKGVLFKQTIH